MRYLLMTTAALAMLTLSACSESDGEDEPFFIFPTALTNFVLQNCGQTSESANPSPINGSSFGRDAAVENTDPQDSQLTATCVFGEAATIQTNG